MTKSKPYYNLVAQYNGLYDHGHDIIFGDYDKQTVKDELEDVKEGYNDYHKLAIIKTNDPLTFSDMQEMIRLLDNGTIKLVDINKKYWIGS